MKSENRNWHPFIPVPKACLEDKRLENAHLLVLLSLYSFMNSKTRTCFPSMSAISERARLTENYTRKRIKELVEFGYVRLVKKGGGRSANTYLLIDQSLQGDSKEPSSVSASSTNQSSPEDENYYRADLLEIDRGNNKNKTIKKELYLSKEKGDDSKILEICNELRQKRFELEPLEDNEDHLKPISQALRKHSYTEVEMVAKHYFGKADCEYLNTFNAFNLSKMSNKLQRTKDHYAQKSFKGDYRDIQLEKLIEGISNER